MGVRREGSGKSKAQSIPQPWAPSLGHGDGGGSIGAGASTDADGDEDSDSEIQEIYVQAYACQFFRDDDAAQAVDDGAHLRPLVIPQEPDSQPLMLDRFDARWMLDPADFSKGSATLNRASSLSAEEQEVDSLRYLDLPAGDHSLEVEGLGRFAPQGSYAHDTGGGLGDQEHQSPPQEEVYGYYGRVASPPPPPTSTTRGSYSAIRHLDNHQEVLPSEEMPASASELADVAEGGGGGGAEAAGDDETFVPSFEVPEGVAVPSSPRQHIMIVGTARTTVRSPQLEVLLRLKQASNAAFSFLSEGDLLHPYYLLLKSWGEAALGEEYARQQRMQTERANARQREEDRETLERERAASAKETSQAVPSGGNDKSDPESDDNAPNLLGGAYDSSDEDSDGDSDSAFTGAAATVAKTGKVANSIAGKGVGAAAPLTSKHVDLEAQKETGVSEGKRVAEARKWGVVEPDDAKRIVIAKMVGFVARNGQVFEDRVKAKENNNPAFDFLQPTNQFHLFYRAELAAAKGQAPPTAGSTGSGALVAEGERSDRVAPPLPSPSTAVSPQEMDKPPVASIESERQTVTDGDPEREGPEQGYLASAQGSGRETNGDAKIHARRSQVGEDFGAPERISGLSSALPTQSARQVRAKAASKLASGIAQDESGGTSGGDVGNGSIPSGLGHDDRSAAKVSAFAVSTSGQASKDEEPSASCPNALEARTKLAVALAQNRDDVAGSESKTEGTDRDALGPSQQPSDDDIDKVKSEPVEDGLGETAGNESAENRRANRLKRARLMKGHYQLAVMRSRGQEPAGGANQPTKGSTTGARGNPDDVGGSPPQGSGDDSDLSDDLSDLDSESDLEDVNEVDSMSEAGGENAHANDNKTTGAHGKDRRKSSSPNRSKHRRSTETDDTTSRRSKHATDRRKRRSRSRTHSLSPRRRRDNTAKEDARAKSRHPREPRSSSRSKDRRGEGERMHSNRDREATPQDRGSHEKRSSRAGEREASGTARAGSDRERKSASDRERKKGDSGKRKRDRDADAPRNGKEEASSSSDKNRRESERRDSRERSSRDGDSRGNRGRRDDDGDSSRRKDSRSSGNRTREREEGRRREEDREKPSSSSSKRSRRN